MDITRRDFFRKVLRPKTLPKTLRDLASIAVQLPGQGLLDALTPPQPVTVAEAGRRLRNNIRTRPAGTTDSHTIDDQSRRLSARPQNTSE